MNPKQGHLLKPSWQETVNFKFFRKKKLKVYNFLPKNWHKAYNLQNWLKAYNLQKHIYK